MSETKNAKTFEAFSPVENQYLDISYFEASTEEVNAACQKAADAFALFRSLPQETRALFLDEIATQIEALGETLVRMVERETGLAEARIEMERARTTAQLRMFAEEIRQKHYLVSKIDRDLQKGLVLRTELRPIGPAAVFGASNFPLAYSVAGGDTAAALASGCPVIFKAHEAHPGTSELVAQAIQKAALTYDLPEGVFSLLQGKRQTGADLVLNPNVASVSFTGSLQGGRALYDLAATRKTPVPVFAEMGSLNPIFVTPSAYESSEDMQTLTASLAQSIVLGGGQFCTKPGIILLQGRDNRGAFLEALKESFIKVLDESTFYPLTPRIRDTYGSQLSDLQNLGSVEFLHKSTDPFEGHLARVSEDHFVKLQNSLKREVFGPFALVVECEDATQMEEVALTFEGELTASFWHRGEDPAGLEELQRLKTIMDERAGRLIYNGVPTGVWPTHSMCHGGPYPATTDGRFTAVGTASIRRYLRPVCYQNWPEELLAPTLRDDGTPDKSGKKPLRRENGHWI